jgi:hypothetical protein
VGSTSTQISSPESAGSHASQATRLVRLAATSSELFQTPEGEAFAAIETNPWRECWAVRSQGFRAWLAQLFYNQEGKVPSGSALADALTVLDGKAKFEGPVRPVSVRVAQGDDDGALYVDLGNDTWEAVRISDEGWNLVPVPPVYFRRTSTTGTLPRPESGRSLEELRGTINAQSDDDFQRIVAWLVGALRPRGPYPVLAIISEQGSGKSVAGRCLRSLVDPSSLPLRGAPREERDLAIAGRGNHVLGFDNVSYVPAWLSDALCRIATGEGWATRRLYTDAEEEVFAFARPIILTGIDDYISSADLLDRSLLASLAAITPNRRRREEELLAEFDAMRPGLVGALFDAVSAALRDVDSVRLQPPRMADFVIWVVAAEERLPWKKGAFMNSLSANAASANEVVMEASPIGELVRTLAAARDPEAWQGTASALLKDLGDHVDDATKRKKGWPSTPRALSGQLRRLAPTLRAVGVEVQFDREPTAKRRRMIVIRAANGSPDGETEKTLDGMDANEPTVDAGRGAMTESAMDGMDGGQGGVDAIDETETESEVDGMDGVDGSNPSLAWEEVVA